MSRDKKRGNAMKKNMIRPAGILLAATMLTPWPASAQSTGPATPQAESASHELLGEIVVTAQKRAEVLRSVPLAISAISSEGLETRGIATINDLGRQAPGLSMVERQNHVPNVVLRGVGSYGFVEGVGFYVDDVQNYTDKTMRLEDLERVEILKGPQGTLFGGSSLGGAVRYISKRPTFDTSMEFKGDLSLSNSYQSAYANANAPVSDVVAMRVSGYRTHDEGFNKDDNLKSSTSEMREYGLRGQVLYEPSEDFSALLTARYRNFDGAYAGYSRQNSIDEVNTHTSLSFKPNYKTETYGFVGQINYDFGAAELTSLSSYTHQKTDYVVDGDYTATPAVKGQADGRPGEVLTQELRLTSEKGERFDWIGGLYASLRRNVGNQVSPLSITAGPAFINPYTDQSSRHVDYAGFGSANLYMGDFTLMGGARLMRTIYKQHSLVVKGAPVTAGSRLTVADTVVLPKASLSYTTEGNTLLYATVAQGYEPGKVDASERPPVAYEPETDWTYELGVKGDLGREFYYELSAFYIDSSDRQGESIIFTPGATVASKRITNIGPARSLGAEAVARWQPVDDLDLEASLSYLDAEWTGNATFNRVALKGRQIPNASRWSANFAATYSVPVSEELELGLHADAAYKGSFPWQLTYDPVSNRNPGYWLVNARVSLGTMSDAWEISARVDNVFNEHYFTEFFPQQLGTQAADGSCVGCHLAATGGLRRVVVSMGLKF